MPSPVFQQFGGNNLLSMIQKFKSDPMGALMEKYNIPNDIKDPNDIIQHLLNTGQVSQEQVNKAMQLGNNPQIRNLIRF